MARKWHGNGLATSSQCHRVESHAHVVFSVLKGLTDIVEGSQLPRQTAKQSHHLAHISVWWLWANHKNNEGRTISARQYGEMLARSIHHTAGETAHESNSSMHDPHRVKKARLKQVHGFRDCIRRPPGMGVLMQLHEVFRSLYSGNPNIASLHFTSRQPSPFICHV
jgi:hypothetical protein